MSAQDDQVVALFKQLRMPHARALTTEVLATAKAQRWEPAETLKAFLEAEVTGRHASMLATKRKQARFPTGKTFDAWDPNQSTIPLPTQQFLMGLEWVNRHENIVLCGPAGTGKSLFAEALGQSVIDAGKTVAWLTTEDLDQLVTRHRIDHSITKAITRVLNVDVVCVDDIGLLPVSEAAAEGLYRVVDAAYERRSVIVTSNVHPSGFDQILPKTLATATVDRLLHHAHLCQTSGESIRFQQAQTGAGVISMPG